MSIERIRQMISASSDGTITAKRVRENGIHRGYLTQMLQNGELVKVGRGLYMCSDAWEDEIYLLQQKFERGIFSHETALYLHGFTDRTPAKFTMTFPHGYSTPLLEKEPIHTKRVIKEKYGIGIVEVETPCNNKVRVYDIERTLCDIVKGQGCDIQIVNDAMKRYARMSGRDIQKLMEYAEIMRVKPKILKYMEVLL